MSRPPRQPSGVHRGLQLLVPETWSPEQALAVFELLDDLRELIAERYLADIQGALQRERQPDHDPRQTDLPFSLSSEHD